MGITVQSTSFHSNDSIVGRDWKYEKYRIPGKISKKVEENIGKYLRSFESHLKSLKTTEKLLKTTKK